MSTYFLKRLILSITVLVFGTFCFFNSVSAETVYYFNDGFDLYNVGMLECQGGWLPFDYYNYGYTCPEGNPDEFSWLVNNERSYIGGKSIKANPNTELSYWNQNYIDITTTTKGVLEFYFYAEAKPSSFGFDLLQGNCCGIIYHITDDNSFDYRSSGDTYTIYGAFTDYELFRWNKGSFEFDLELHRARIGLNDVFSEWASTTSNQLYINRLLVFFDYVSTYDFFVDNITMTSETLLPQVCSFGSYCTLCETQETCESHDCWWSNDLCWSIEPATTTSWPDYYAEHSEFTTTTPFVSYLSNFTAPFLENIETWLLSFAGFFSQVNAVHYGEQLGGAIPTARSYLGIFNSFFGDFPVSEIFIFFLTALVVFVVYRQIRNLINLVKP
ncbi:MAG TPA: hypothetical protein VMW25_06635 [Clostridia bacterium]|nr:hypothetical protein [Clostridia bacterium]